MICADRVYEAWDIPSSTSFLASNCDKAIPTDNEHHVDA